MRRKLVAAFLALAAGLALPGAVRGEGRIPVDLELVLAVDISGSIDAEEARLQRDGYVRALTSKEVLDVIRNGVLGGIGITYLEWASYPDRRLVADWTLVKDEADARALAGRLAAAPLSPGRRTSITGAIEFAMAVLDASPFEGTRRVIDISGDGPNNEGGLVTAARDLALARGYVINGLPIINDRRSPWGMPNMENLDLYYEDCVIGGPGAFVVVAESFDTFAEAVKRKLILEIAALPPAATRFAHSPERLLRPAQGRARPPCDAGERQLRRWSTDRWQQ
ncbi:MAG: DUF1194 domain-containing protein [Thalassobaculales bacterium]